MNYVVHGIGITLHPEPRWEVSPKRSGVIPPKLGAGKPPIAIRARRRSLPRVLAAQWIRHHRGGPPSPDRWPCAGSGVSPIAGGATRGVAFLIDR